MTDKQNQAVLDDRVEINLLEVAQLLIKRKMFIIKLCSVAVLASVIYSLTLPNIYSATAKLVPPQKDAGGGLSAMLGQMGGLAGLAAGGLGGGSDLYLGILKSRSVADAVVQRLDLVKVYQSPTLEAARLRLDAAVKVQAGKDGIITISAEDLDPKRAALLANTVVDELGRTTVRLNLSKAGTERAFLEKRLAQVKTDLKAAEESLKVFSQSSKIIQVDSQAKASIEGIARLKGELAKEEVQLAVMSSNQTEQSPEVKALQTGIRRLRAELTSLAGPGSGGEGIPNVGNLPSAGLEYSRKLRDFKVQEAIFEQLTKQYEMAKINETKDSSSLQVLDEAVVPVSKSRPKRSLIVVVSAVTAFLVSILIIFAQEYFGKMSEEDRRIVDGIKKQALSYKDAGS